MNQIVVVSLLSIVLAVLIVGLGLPLIFRKVRMNDIYGARFKASFKSEKNWYEINTYGGKAMCVAALPITACGAVGFSLQGENAGWCVWLNVAVWLVAVLVAAVLTWLKARRMDRKNTGRTDGLPE